MPAISTVDLCWSTPDGQSVISNLNLTFNVERAGIVGRNGVGKTSLLKLLSGAHAPTSGRIVVQGTIATLRQIVQVQPDETIADLFGVAADLDVLRRAERGMADIDELADADWSLDPRIAGALASVRLDATPDARLSRLSGGQRTRAAMAAVVLEQPDFLLLDEPTNNLDREGRTALFDLLDGWRAGAIIVSHDRELLETMDAIVEMTTLGATRYGGNWTRYRERKTVELAAVRHDLDVAERQTTEIARKTQIAAERKQRRDAAGSRKGARGDMPRILAGARKQRAENSGGENARLAERRREAAAIAAIAAREQIEILETMAVSLAKTGLVHDKIVLALEHVTAGHDPAAPLIRDLSFTIAGPERIAITGPNGSGKTTLLDVIIGRIEPWSGRIARTPGCAMLDQSVDILDPSLSIVDNFRALNADTDEFACRSALARFQFRADAANRIVGTLSGGQLLRAGLACTLGGTPPQLLVLDEPTNHLDLDSIAAVEVGLSAFDGALLVVSHDETFLAAIGISRRLDMSGCATGRIASFDSD
jgi:ATPase subunit of ABC transporter with duplicated ATPase domains